MVLVTSVTVICIQFTQIKQPRGFKHVQLLSSTCHQNEEYLGSHRICHAIVCCRMVPVPYAMFSNTAGIGCRSKEKRKTFHESHKESVEHVYNESIEEALMEEMGMHEALDGIDIMIDATHG